MRVAYYMVSGSVRIKEKLKVVQRTTRLQYLVVVQVFGCPHLEYINIHLKDEVWLQFYGQVSIGQLYQYFLLPDDIFVCRRHTDNFERCCQLIPSKSMGRPGGNYPILYFCVKCCFSSHIDDAKNSNVCLFLFQLFFIGNKQLHIITHVTNYTFCVKNVRKEKWQKNNNIGNLRDLSYFL